MDAYNIVLLAAAVYKGRLQIWNILQVRTLIFIQCQSTMMMEAWVFFFQHCIYAVLYVIAEVLGFADSRLQVRAESQPAGFGLDTDT